MAESIKVFENSLRDYLINAQQDSYNSASNMGYRYNNLKVYMEPQKNKIPHFCVSLGISEVCYMINPLQRMSGSLGGNYEKYIIMWASRPNISGELRKHWAYLMKAVTIDVDTVLEEKPNASKDSNKSQKPINEEQTAEFASEIITGAGVKVAKQNNEETDSSKNKG